VHNRPAQKINCLLRHYYAENITPQIFLQGTKNNEAYQVFYNIVHSKAVMDRNIAANSLHEAIDQDINFSIELFSVHVNKIIKNRQGGRAFFRTFSRLIKANIENALPEKRNEFEQALQKASDKDFLIQWVTWPNNKEKIWHFSQSGFFSKLKETFPTLKEPSNTPTALENAELLLRYNADVIYPSSKCS